MEASGQDYINIFSMRQVHKGGLLFLPEQSYVRESGKHSFNTEVIVDSSISHVWMLHAVFLSDGNDLSALRVLI